LRNFFYFIFISYKNYILSSGRAGTVCLPRLEILGQFFPFSSGEIEKIGFKSVKIIVHKQILFKNISTMYLTLSAKYLNNPIKHMSGACCCCAQARCGARRKRVSFSVKGGKVHD